VSSTWKWDFNTLFKTQQGFEQAPQNAQAGPHLRLRERRVHARRARRTAMKKLRIVRLGLALGDREWRLNDGQIQNPSAQS
jgi:hypothetical protein